MTLSLRRAVDQLLAIGTRKPKGAAQSDGLQAYALRLRKSLQDLELAQWQVREAGSPEELEAGMQAQEEARAEIRRVLQAARQAGLGPDTPEGGTQPSPYRA